MGDPQFAAIAFDMTRMRTVEQRRRMVRTSTSGPSGVVDPWGRVRAALPFDVAGAVGGAIEPWVALTVYARAGDAFAVACVVATAVGLALSRRRPDA